MSVWTQIGWYTVKEPRVAHKADFSFAAWWEDIELKPGRYPVNVPDVEIYGSKELFAQGAYVKIPGTTVQDYFAAHYCGMPVSDYDTKKNAGRASEYRIFDYLFDVAESVLSGDSPYELFPEYEARKEDRVSMFDNTEYTSYGIFKKSA